MSTPSAGQPVNARDVKEGDRLMIRRDGYADVIVVVDDVAENEDGTVELTVTEQRGWRTAEWRP